jgi:hypothetical protein
MPKFRTFIHGVNFHVHLSDSDTVKPHGFYVNAFIEAESPEKAELEAIELIRECPKLHGAVYDSADDPPRMFVEEIQEIADWPPDTVRPLTGFALYDEEAERNP